MLLRLLETCLPFRDIFVLSRVPVDIVVSAAGSSIQITIDKACSGEPENVL